jgi:hypothetical protein
MFVTAAVFHFEMSALNALADWNAVGGCRKSKQIKSRKRKKKTRGVSGQNSSENSKGQQKKQVE